jgi:antitoxin component of RelBE/YafQ-DinJ toxin-antitoxin module
MARPRKDYDTATMSTRVPVDVKMAFEQLCSAAGVVPSRALAQLVVRALREGSRALGDGRPGEED